MITVEDGNEDPEAIKDEIDQMLRDAELMPVHSITVNYILEIACKWFGKPIYIVRGKSRKREIVEVRQTSMYYSKHLTKKSLGDIGKQIGGKDHATVLHSVKTIQNLRDTDKKFNSKLEDFEKAYGITIEPSKS
jgi:chromosomal replication initiator protein